MTVLSITRHIKRFGEYLVNPDQEPEALEPETWVFLPDTPEDSQG